jgi:exopolysaccharide production protein ExoQ
MIMKSRLFFYPTEGHNGYLDVINDLGMVGAVCLLGYLISYLRQGLQLLAAVRPQGILYLTLLFEQLVANLTESRWFNVLTCEFTIMTIATVAMGRTLLDLHMQRRSAAAARTASPRAAPGRRVVATRRTV